MMRNIARDTSTSLMQSDYGINPIDIVKGYWSALTKDEIYREFVAMGGGRNITISIPGPKPKNSKIRF